jgi:DNA-binding transcriptional regulator YiaG
MGTNYKPKLGNTQIGCELVKKSTMRINNLARLRKRSGLSQQQLADKVGTTSGMIGKLERGERRLSDDYPTILCNADNPTLIIGKVVRRVEVL